MNAALTDITPARIQRRPVAAPVVGCDPVLGRIFAARGIAQAEQLKRDFSALPAPEGLTGTAEAAELLAEAIRENRRILIVGDYDCDGATSTALCLLALRGMGATRVDFLVPNRFQYGYGLTPEIVALASQRKPELLMTVDNGIASLAGVAAANAAGMRVIVTDHHLPGAELPAAAALVNPRLPGNERFAGFNLAGCGVAFYVLAATRARLRDSGWFQLLGHPALNLADLLDLVALGTVADLVALDQVNRTLVHQGLQRIRAGRCRPGILALCRVAGRDHRRLTATDLGFALGPRLNAAGRLDDMAEGIACLLDDSYDGALERAQALDRLNRERRSIESNMEQQALAELEGLDLQGADTASELPYGLCLYQDGWHQGVIGILAARIRERYHRPVIAFAPGDAGQLKGSARSVPNLHIRDALDAVASAHPGLIEKFGGHAMAAGLTIAIEQFDAFRQAFDAVVRRQLSADDLCDVLHSDGELAPAQLELELAQALRDAGPWGQGFPEPLFDGAFEIAHSRVVGEHHLKLQLRPDAGGEPVNAIAFRQAERHALAVGDRIHAAYRLDVNEYRGSTSLQLVVEHIDPVTS